MPEIKGRCLDSETMSPISDSRVDLKKDGSVLLRTATDSNGRFSFKDIPPGNYEVEVHSLYHFPASTKVNVTSLSAAEVSLYSAKSILSVSEVF